MSANKSLLRSAAVDESWANTLDRAGRTANGRKAFLDRFEEQAAQLAREHGVQWSPEELAIRAEGLRKSVKVRKAKSLRARIPVNGGGDDVAP